MTLSDRLDWKRGDFELDDEPDSSRAAAKPALALLGPDATEDELLDFVEALTGRPEDRSVPP